MQYDGQLITFNKTKRLFIEQTIDAPMCGRKSDDLK